MMQLAQIKRCFPTITDDDPAVYVFKDASTVLTVIVSEGRVRVSCALRDTIKG